MPDKPNTIIVLVAAASLAVGLGAYLVTWHAFGPSPQELPEREATPPVPGAQDAGEGWGTPFSVADTGGATADPVLRPQLPEGPIFRLIQPEGPDPAPMALINDPAADRLTRVRAIAALGNNLDTDEINALYRLMLRHPEEARTGIDALNLLKNEAAEVLLRQEMPVPFFASNLVAMFLDGSYDRIWRDYCMQFLGRCMPQQNAAGKALVARVLLETTETMDGPIIGTTLIALQRNAADPLIGRQRVADLAHACAVGDASDPDSRTTALQVCAELGDRRVLPAATTLAADTSLSLRLRISAIAAIGQLGDRSNRAELEAYSQQGNTTIRLAAQAALQRLGI